ncbi:hypothetical protein BRADI_3g44450v3 [Brachypodium distachyon]|uniref:RING-type E3 ubiquitin transferase n=1 Tax=Brachypodium distachyon TaxID=15368 RepID=I1IA25_BRADI|nr:hypothetical protein BRADI_3g44450v3 [Brachypodium distachyon]
MLSTNIVAALSQLRHMKSDPDVVPYISLAMLGAQALGHGVALVTADAKKMMMPAAAAAWRWRPTYDGYRTDIHGLQHSWDIVDGCVRALALATLLITLRIARKARRARAQSPPLEPGRVPCDWVPLLCAHLGVLLFVLAVHCLDTPGMSTTTADPQTIYYEARAEPYTPPSRAWGAAAVVERSARLNLGMTTPETKFGAFDQYKVAAQPRLVFSWPSWCDDMVIDLLASGGTSRDQSIHKFYP